VSTVVVVDAANVMGSRPDGWWKDRAGAAVRLYTDLVGLAERGVAVPGADGEVSFVLVLEGAARSAMVRIAPAGATVTPTTPAAGPVRVVLAVGSGDDAIVDAVRELHGHCVVVTADRELRRRCAAEGATVLGPGWLLGQLRRLPLAGFGQRNFGPPGPFRRAAHFPSRPGALRRRMEHRSRQKALSAGLCGISLVLISGALRS
jgi:hypothetical protein